MTKQRVLHQDAGQRLQRDLSTWAAAVITTLGHRGRNAVLGKKQEILASLFVIAFCLFAWGALIVTLLSLG